MAELTARPRTARRPAPEIVVDRVWRFFCSVRAAVYEVAILAMLVLAGTLRGSSVPQWLADWVPALQGFVDAWYGWDVFHSLPFIFMLALISVAIAVCTVNRAPGIWRAIAHPTVTTTHGFLNSAELSARFSVSEEPAPVGARVQETMRRRRYRVLTQERDGQLHVYGDRFRYAKLGTFPFHLALILILVGGIVGARYGFRETSFAVPEGSVREVGRGTGLSVGLQEFSDTYRENGQASEYRSDLVLYEDGKEVKRGSITVNHPMSHGSVVFYQSSFGQAVSLRVTDERGRELFNDSIALGLWTARTNPDAPAGIVELPQVGASLHVIAPDANRDNQPELDALKLTSGEMYVQIRPGSARTTEEMPGAVVAQGETARLGTLDVTFIRERQFTLLQVASNPGMPIFWTAAFLLVGGLAIVFYFPHRRVRGIISDTPSGAVAHLAPLAKRDWSGKREFQRLVADLEAALSTPALVRERYDADDNRENARPRSAQSTAV